MTEDSHDSVRKKVEALFIELAGDRARMLDGSRFPAGITSTITASLSGPDASDEQVLQADTIAFHLTDWNADAAFIVALHLYPELSTPEEIEAGVELFLGHVPGHVIAAARLAGYPVEGSLRKNDTENPRFCRNSPNHRKQAQKRAILSATGCRRMTLYDNRPTDFFSATKEFHGLASGLFGDAGESGRRMNSA